uniref:Reverse transcriptase domain-containing protein n=1 Tax=Cyprinus carpio TaxID=7962 RepID=A0A8C1RWE5_CYPCA
MIRPLLKKPTLDPDVLANYRPISNLPFLSKVLEKVVVSHLQDHLKHNNLFEKFQSGFRTAHSTETALVRVTNDLRMTADAGSPSLLILLDLSAAFDTVDHGILLNRLHHTIGLTGTALNWFKSYLTNRTEYISLGSARSRQHTVTCGVPQGSVLGPILFIIYMIPLGHVISRYGVSFHCYADDTQLYMKTSPTSFSSSTLTACLEEIRVWMKHNFLQLNSSKTEAILVGTPRQTQSSSITGITITDHVISLSTTVTNLGVRFDPQLSFEAHIKNLCKTSFYHLRNIAKLRPMLTLADAEKLVHAFVSSRLDYCNALLIGIPNKSLQRLQYVQNSAARILMRVRKYDHITPILHSLHWLPVSARIEYKMSLLTYQCIYGNAPPI